MEQQSIFKYPRTPHLEGSTLQIGDEDLGRTPRQALVEQQVVITEKVDGANAGISFERLRKIRLQCRGHFLSGGPREHQFDLFKQWSHTYAHPLFEVLGYRWLVFGEWLYAKHTIFYDALPHYFLVFDVFDRENALFLSTPKREALLAGSPLVPVPVLWSGVLGRNNPVESHLGPSAFISPNWRDALAQSATARGLDLERAFAETDQSGLMEGLYLKVEDNERVISRCKWVRPSFRQQLDASGDHWSTRHLIANRLRPGVVL